MVKAWSSIRRIKWWRILFDARQAAGGRVFVEAEDVSVHDFDNASSAAKSKIRFRAGGESHELTCDFIAGCDGFHGICRPSIPAGALTIYDRVYPFGWLGILAEAPPSSDELIYAYHERGFALLSMRSPEISRLYVQCAPDEDIDEMVRRSHMAGVAHPAGHGRREMEAHRGTDLTKRRHRDAQLRGRADAVSESYFWPGMRRTSFRPPARRD